MPETAVSAPATAPSAAPSAPAPSAPTTPPPSSAAPAAAATPPPAATPPAAKADAPVSPTGKQDVRSGLMDAAKAAVVKMRKGQPSAQVSQGTGAAAPTLPAGATGEAAPPPQSTEAKGSDAASASGTNASGPADGAADPAAAAAEDDETKPPPFNDHPRWKKLNRDHEKLTRDHEAVTAQVAKLTPDADQYRKILHYMDTFELDAEDVATAYDITAKLKHNPQLAYQALKPIWDELCRRVGVTLPDDLAQKVKQGFIDQATAQELAQQRAATVTARQTATRFSDQTQRQQQQQTVGVIKSAVAKWDAQQVAKSPDFTRLRPFVEERARSIMVLEGRATTPDAAIAVLDRALKDVTERLQPFHPPAANGSTPKQPVAGTPSTAVAPPEPKSLREAAQLGLEGRYRPAN